MLTLTKEDFISPKKILLLYWAIQRSWFARVNALCNLSRERSQRTSGPISE